MQFISPVVYNLAHSWVSSNKLDRDPVSSAARQRTGQRIIRKRLLLIVQRGPCFNQEFEWFKQPVVKQATGFFSPPLFSSASSLVPSWGLTRFSSHHAVEVDFINIVIPVVSQIWATNHMPFIYRKLTSSVKLPPLISLRERNNR